MLSFSLDALGEVYPPSTHFLSFPLGTNSFLLVFPNRNLQLQEGHIKAVIKSLTKASFFLTDLHLKAKKKKEEKNPIDPDQTWIKYPNLNSLF